MAKIETVVFDLGGVLIDWDPRHLYRKLNIPEEKITWLLANVLTSQWNHEMDAGKSFQKGVKERSKQFPEYAQLIEAYWTRWPEMIGGPMIETEALLNQLYDKGVPLFALTNWSHQTFNYVSHYGLFQKFQGVLVSGIEKMAKPDPAFFKLMFKRFGMLPESTLFIDDNAANIQAAKNLGMVTVHFQHAQGLEKKLKELKLI